MNFWAKTIKLFCLLLLRILRDFVEKILVLLHTIKYILNALYNKNQLDEDVKVP